MGRIHTTISLSEDDNTYINKYDLKPSWLVSEAIANRRKLESNTQQSEALLKYEQEITKLEREKTLLWKFIQMKNLGGEFIQYKRDLEQPRMNLGSLFDPKIDKMI